MYYIVDIEEFNSETGDECGSKTVSFYDTDESIEEMLNAVTKLKTLKHIFGEPYGE